MPFGIFLNDKDFSDSQHPTNGFPVPDSGHNPSCFKPTAQPNGLQTQIQFRVNPIQRLSSTKT